MPKENNDVRGALVEFMRLLDEGCYFEAHEVLEEAWHYLKRIGDARAPLARGLINGAIAFAHIKKQSKRLKKQVATTMGAYERHKAKATPMIEDSDLFIEACDYIERLKKRFSEHFDDVLVSRSNQA